MAEREEDSLAPLHFISLSCAHTPQQRGETQTHIASTSFLKMRMVSNTSDPFTFYLLLPGVGVGEDPEGCPGAPLLRDLNI